ncbi:MAG: membrane protein insertase YidC [Gammaproteobacteria bacterium]
MDTTRLILITSLTLVSLLLYEAWQRDYGLRVVPPPTTADGAAAVPPDLPPGADEIPAMSEAAESPAISETVPEQQSQADYIDVYTDVLHLKINKRGGALEYAELLQYPVEVKQQDVPVVFLDNSNSLVHVIQTGLLGQSAPNHQDRLTGTQDEYRLQDRDELRVPLHWQDANGVTVSKVFVLRRGSYLIDIDYQINNPSSEPWVASTYSQIKRDTAGTGRKLVYTYTGAVISSPEDRYSKIDFDEIEEQDLSLSIKNGWAAMLQHYFVSAIIPTLSDSAYQFSTKALKRNQYLIRAVSPLQRVEAGAEGRLNSRVYVGPKLQEQLAEAAEGLELTVDYGILFFIAKPLFWCLAKFHELTGNWGWAIILVTIVLKLLFFPLSAAGYRSMANMRRVQPRMMAMKERYKDDRNGLNQAMMKLYKEEKINPFGGCLPILVQIPVFIALYWVLLESVELRQAYFALWLVDLSSPDPYWVLPIIMGATMLIQQKLNPAPMDPLQQKVLMIMPFAFTIFFGFFPSGLVLYWVANNILSIAQQWQITRGLEKAGLAAGTKK